MRLFRYILLVVFSTLSLSMYGQELPERALLRQGNKDFEKGRFTESVERYKQALEHLPESYEVRYNLGSALFKADSAEQAVKILQPLSQDTLLSDKQRSELFYNLGNIAFEGQDLQAALENYKQSLRLNPEDMQAKFNYAYTKKLLEQQQDEEQNQDDQGGEDEQEQDENQDDQGGDGEQEQNQDQNQDQGDNGEDEQEQEQNQDQQQDQGGDDEQEQPSGQQPQGGMSEQQQEQILDAIQAQEDKTQEKLEGEEVQGVLIRGAKNW